MKQSDIEKKFIDYQNLVLDFANFIKKLSLGIYKKQNSDLTTLHQKLSDIEKEFLYLSKFNISRAKEIFQNEILPLTNKSDFCSYSLNKPRGYVGDFVAMEKIWNGRTNEEFRFLGSDEIGKFLNSFTLDSPNCIANEYRVNFFKNILKLFKNSDIASIGCGSVLELQELYKEDKNLGNNNFYLFDSDKGALDFVKNKLHNCKNINYSYGNVLRQIIKFDRDVKFDFIYSSGLFDYLALPQAQKVAKNLFSLLKICGKLIITNARPENPSKFWMENTMDWYLDYKDQASMKQIADLIDKNDFKYNLFFDENNVYQYLQIEKLR